jgi:hypothetical protein
MSVPVGTECYRRMSVPVGIKTGMQPEHPRDHGSIPGSFIKCCLGVSVQTDALPHPASYPVRIGGCFLGLSRPRYESNYLPANHAKTRINGAVTQFPHTLLQIAWELIYL